MLLVAGSHSVCAQALALGAASPADSLAAPLAADTDTVAALHRLFASQRRKRSYVVGVTAVVVGAGLIPDSSPGAIISQRVAVLFLGIPVLGAELLYYNAFSQKREQRAVAAFEAHQLPRALRRRLKARYFR
ncbi:hypothetical protein [Hymenobacter bucti]|uniref:hypothetical protein n=1 Tax=Hymenobacter bucti TaxID=1844114 RepID=UPI0036D33CE0